VLNPPAGFVQSCNSTPFHATAGEGNPKPEAFPKSMGVETHETNRSRRAQELYGGDNSITREEFYAYKFDKTYSAKSDVGWYLDKLFQADIPQEPNLQEGVRLLKSWDRAVTKDNKAAALGILVGYPHSRRDAWAGKPFDHVNVLREATRFLKKHYGRLDVPLQEVLRLRHGKQDLGLAGGPDCLRAVYFEVNDDGHLIGVGGDCYIQMVEWDKEGRMHSEAVIQYGSATGDKRSPHYADQAPLFADEKMHPVLLTEEEVRKHFKREYRPGETDGPWYTQ
jgi:acyl-homoserine-lactone acylase